MIPKICLFCDCFSFVAGSPTYSEYTPGSCSEMKCLLGHWTYDFDNDDLYDIMATAINCNSFTIDTWAIKKFNLIERNINDV